MPPVKRENRLYKKGKAFKDSRKFIIVCEGLREAEYFNYFHDKYRKLIVKVLEPSGEYHGHSAPNKLMERASEYIESDDWDVNLDDELWFIVDTDTWGRHLHELSEMCNNTKSWFIANSNPCFEVWLYYHQQCQRISETSANSMKQILNAQTNGGYNLTRYINRIEQAIECSSRLDDHPDQNIADIGITKVYQLGTKILELLPRRDGSIALSEN